VAHGLRQDTRSGRSGVPPGVRVLRRGRSARPARVRRGGLTDSARRRWYHRRQPQPRSPPEPDPLDDPQQTPSSPDPAPPPDAPGVPPAGTAPPSTEASSRPAGGSTKPPGLREQIGSTRDSAKRLFDAHLELARAEFEEIGGAIKRAAVLGVVAVVALIVAGLLATVGIPLFLGEWIFGSIGWGLLHGLLLLAGIATIAGLGALGTDPSRLGRSTAIALAIAILVGVFLGLDLTNRAWSVVGDALVPLVAAESRPLVAALIGLPIVLGIVIGLAVLVRSGGSGAGTGTDRPSVGARAATALPAAVYVGWLANFAYAYSSGAVMPDWRIVAAALVGAFAAELILVVIAMWPAGQALVKGLSTGVMLGLGLAFLTALAVGGRVGAAIGLTAGLIAWPALMGADLAARGIDTEALKERFIPSQTIEMTKETIEWARERTPLTRR
jgi:hypothetical protein